MGTDQTRILRKGKQVQQLIQLPGGNWVDASLVSGVRVSRDRLQGDLPAGGYLVFVDIHRDRSMLVARWGVEELAQAELLRDRVAVQINDAREAVTWDRTHQTMFDLLVRLVCSAPPTNNSAYSAFRDAEEFIEQLARGEKVTA
jgi:hypothetical protein